MKIYLAARYSRRDEMREVASRLREMGYVVTSRWFDTEWGVRAADCVVSFTEAPKSGSSRGGRHVEFGMAVAWGKRLVVVGHRENLFHHLPEVTFFEDTPSMLAHFGGVGSDDEETTQG